MIIVLCVVVVLVVLFAVGFQFPQFRYWISFRAAPPRTTERRARRRGDTIE